MFSINIVETKKINELDHIYHTIMMKRFHIHNTTITLEQIIYAIINHYNKTVLISSNFY